MTIARSHCGLYDVRGEGLDGDNVVEMWIGEDVLQGQIFGARPPRWCRNDTGDISFRTSSPSTSSFIIRFALRLKWCEVT